MHDLFSTVVGIALAAAQTITAATGADAAEENPITVAGDAFDTSINGGSINAFGYNSPRHLNLRVTLDF